MKIENFKSNKFPKKYIPALNKLSFANGFMKASVIPRLNKKEFVFDVYCCFDDNGNIIAWAYNGVNVFNCNSGFYVKSKYRRQGIGTALVNEMKKQNNDITTGPHDAKSLAFFKKTLPDAPTYHSHAVKSKNLKYSRKHGYFYEKKSQ